MRVGEYLFHRLKALGVRHAFGIPGDFALPLYQVLERLPIQPIVVTHEPAAGFAADAYARLKGLGVTLVTFGAGALNMVNAIAQAYAERSPVLVVSGAPEIHNRRMDVLVHHKVRTFESQLTVYREITCAAAALNDPRMALEEIDRVVDAVLRWKRPGYLEIPRDVVFARGARSHRAAAALRQPDPAALQEVMAEVVHRLNRSRQPVIYAGIEIERFGLIEKLVALAEKLNLPVVTSMDGKTVFPETHRNFVGIYMGKVGSPEAREVVEGSDCVLMLGAFLTDVSTGLFTAKVDRASLISASSEEVSVSHHRYPDVTLVDLVEFLLTSPAVKRRTFTIRRRAPLRVTDRSGGLTTRAMVEELNAFLNGGFATLQAIAGKKPYFGVAPWDYVRIAESLGGRGVRVQTRVAFRAALGDALKSRNFFLIEAVLSPTDLSPTWTRIASEVRSRLRPTS